MFKIYKEELVVIFLTILSLVGLLMLAAFIDCKSCRINAKDMSVNYKYDIIGGCRFEVEDNIYIHHSMYRKMQ